MPAKLKRYDDIAAKLVKREIGKVLLLPVPISKTQPNYAINILLLLRNRGLQIKVKMVGLRELAVWRTV